MDTQTTDAVEQRTRGMRAGGRAALILLFILAAVVALMVGLRLARPGTLPGVMVAGVPLGGLEEAELEARLSALGERLVAEQITMTRTEPPAVEAEAVARSAGELGFRFDVEATSERVMARGRQANPVAALADHLRAFRATTVIEPVEVLDDRRLAEEVDDLAEQLEVDAVTGAVSFDAGQVRRIDPVPGAEVDVEQLATRLRTAVLSPGDAQVDVPVLVDPPEITRADVEAAFADAQAAMSGTVVLTRGEVLIPLGPEAHLSDILSVEPGGEDADGRRLELVADPAAVAVAVPDATEEALATDPVDAQVGIVDGAVVITPSAEGFAFDPVAAAEQIEELAVRTDPAARTAELRGTILPPVRTTEEVQALGITGKVSEFTTYHACCQSRVTNIQQMARTVDGHIIEPGETFSLNEFIGPRTREKGYVPGGAILNGEYIQDVGGGVSQFTTTMYNAAFFGGYAIPEHKAHSYYISRYPAGREATLDYPSVDLKIANNSPYGILVNTSYTSTSITVEFWGTKWVDVGMATGPRHNYREAETQYRDNPDLPVGETRVVQSAAPGFDIVVNRTLTFPDGRTEQEEIFTRYQPQPRIVERGTQPAAPPPPPPPSPPSPPDAEADTAEDAQEAEASPDAEATQAPAEPEPTATG